MESTTIAVTAAVRHAMLNVAMGVFEKRSAVCVAAHAQKNLLQSHDASCDNSIQYSNRIGLVDTEPSKAFKIAGNGHSLAKTHNAALSLPQLRTAFVVSRSVTKATKDGLS